MTKQGKMPDEIHSRSVAVMNRQFMRMIAIRLVAPGIVVALASSVLAQSPSSVAASWDKAGKAARDRKDYATAIVDFQKAVQINPLLAIAWMHMGMTYNDQQQYQQASAVFRKYLTLSDKPDEQAAWLLLGIADEQLKQYSEAASAFRSLIRLDPEPGMMYKAHLELGKSLIFLHQLPDAATAFKEAIRLYPDDTEARDILPEVEKAIARDRNNQSASGGTSGQAASPAFANAARCKKSVDSGSYADAVDVCNQVVRSNPRGTDAWSNLGTAYFGLKRYPEAAQTFQQVTRLDPNNARAQYGVGAAYLEMKQYDKAVPYLREAVRLDADNANEWYDLGHSLYEIRQFTEAARALQRADRLLPSDDNTEYWLGRTYVQLGRRTEALAAYQKLASTDADAGKKMAQRLSTEITNMR